MWLLVSDDKDEFDQFILAASEQRTGLASCGTPEPGPCHAEGQNPRYLADLNNDITK